MGFVLPNKFLYMVKKILYILVLLPMVSFSQEYSEYMEKIGESSRTSYVMYTANNGDLYYVDIDEADYLDMLKYEKSSGETVVIAENFAYRFNDQGIERNEGIGSIAPTADGNTVYCMTTDGRNPEIFKLDVLSDTYVSVVKVFVEDPFMGFPAGWRIFNMTLSEDEKSIFIVNNNASYDNKGVYKVDIETGITNKVLSLSELLGSENLCFGGVNVWDNDHNFYVPVWRYANPEWPDYIPENDNTLKVLKVHVEGDTYSAEKIYFTDNGQEDGAPLLPGFRNHSCWSGIGASSLGNIYIASSNHYQTSDGNGIHGNVAIYKYDPVADKMSFINDIKSVSESVNNWIGDESQHKVHTFLLENSDGKIYFASDDYEPSSTTRGGHVYTLDINTDEIVDYSKTQDYVMLEDFAVIDNGTEPSATSGVFIERYGIKGLSLNSNSPNDLYAMTFSYNDYNPSDEKHEFNSGYVIKHAIDGVLGIGDELTVELSMYPNPVSNGRFEIKFAHSNFSVQILNLNGQIVYANDMQNDVSVISTLNLNAGMYLVKVSTDDYKTFTKKLIVR